MKKGTATEKTRAAGPRSRDDDEERPGARALWKGSITFGLVNIPVALHPATKTEELRFRLLRKTDLSPVNYKRVAAVDGREVPWDQIVKGYEYDKGKFVVLKEEDFKRVDLEAAETIDIMDFVDLAEINPMYFLRPYYMEPERGGAGAYALLRDVLASTNKTGIAKVVIRTRQHLAAIKATGDLLILELMHFSHELVDGQAYRVSGGKAPGPREKKMAETLVEQMTEKWDPKRYTDDYASALLKLINRKVAGGGQSLPEPAKTSKAASNVIDLVSILQKSLDETGRGQRKRPGGGKPSRAA